MMGPAMVGEAISALFLGDIKVLWGDDMGYIYIDNEIEPYLQILIDCVKIKGKDIREQIKRITEDTNLMAECLEDNFLEFKLHCKKIRDEYEKAVTSEINKNYEVWEKCDELITSSRPTIEKITKELQEPLKMLQNIEESLESVSLWKLDKLLEVIEKYCKMPADEKALFTKLLKE